MFEEGRIEKLLTAIGKRQWNITVVLENVHDPHNLGAVMRSCESVGITEVYILYTEETTNPDRYIGRNASGGVSKWIKSHFYSDLQQCFSDVKAKYGKLYATHLYTDSVSVYEKNLCESMAFVFGNEHKGVSEEALALCDGNIMIPMQGLAESLNVSVACSIILYETMRQRMTANLYSEKFDAKSEKMTDLLNQFLRRARPRIYEKNPQVLFDEIDQYLIKNEMDVLPKPMEIIKM